MLYGEQVDFYFADLTRFQPRQFQQYTIAHLLQRQNVLLRAPTGSGKTETAIAPFLFAIDQLLSNFLSSPYSVGRGSANVNAGAFQTSPALSTV